MALSCATHCASGRKSYSALAGPGRRRDVSANVTVPSSSATARSAHPRVSWQNRTTKGGEPTPVVGGTMGMTPAPTPPSDAKSRTPGRAVRFVACRTSSRPRRKWWTESRRWRGAREPGRAAAWWNAARCSRCRRRASSWSSATSSKGSRASASRPRRRLPRHRDSAARGAGEDMPPRSAAAPAPRVDVGARMSVLRHIVPVERGAASNEGLPERASRRRR